MSLNLHKITRPIITAVHPDEQIKICICTGQTVDDSGIVVPAFAAPVSILAQVQNYADGEQRKNGINFNEERIRVFINTNIVELRALSRPEKPGDMIQRSDTTWWRVVDIDNEFGRVGWVSAICVRQVTPPEGLEVEQGAE